MQNPTSPDGSKSISLPYEVVTFERNAEIPPTYNDKPGFYYIEKGQVKINAIFGDVARTIFISHPGDFVGINLHSHSILLTAVTLNPVTAYFYDQTSIDPLNNAPHGLQAFIRNQLYGSILRTGFRIWSLQAHSVKSRVAGTLLGLIDPTGMRIEGIFGKTIDSIDRKTLAELSGTVIETLSRVLTELEQAEIIFRDKRTIQILKPVLLMKIAANS